MATTISYSPKSFYARTPISGRFLTYYVGRNIPEHQNDALFTIERDRHVNRPDNIAADLYGNDEYWWVFGVRNQLQDLVFDLRRGLTIVVPDGNYLRTLLG